MKTRRQRGQRNQRRGRGGTRKIHFANNVTSAPSSNNSNEYAPEDPKYLSNLYEAMHKIIPIPSSLQERDAQILAEVMEMYDDPKDMEGALRRIYKPEEVTAEELAYINKKQPLHKQLARSINTLNASNLSFTLKQKILNRLRFNRAIHKLYAIFIKNSSNPRFIHKEWNRTNTSENNSTK